MAWFENMDLLFSESPPYNNDTVLVLDILLISEAYLLPDICDRIKKVIVVGEGVTSEQQVQLIFGGASGYSDKSIDRPLIKRAIESVVNNEIWLERQLIPQVLQGIVAQQYALVSKDKLDKESYKTLSNLTPREIEVVKRMYNGEDNLTISNSLHISVRTVKAHLTAIFRKLDVQDRFQLVVYLKNLHIGHISKENEREENFRLD
jgi:DNA-binding NarL/FixJ family response regulator